VIRAFSIGDVVIAVGVIVTLVDLFAPRIRREGGSGESGGH
jgi:hypothetical protein